MSYTIESELDSATHQRERELLSRGLSYGEVAEATGGRVKSISERNRLVYKVDLTTAFRRRVEREGVPNRLSIDPAFGYWFSGYFDGEGCLTIFYRERNGLPERRVGVQIACRDDDCQLLDRIARTLGVGVCWKSRQKGTTQVAANWRVERAADLAEVIVPLFDLYPLHSKKRHEYAVWRTLVVDKYVHTLGGRSSRVSLTSEQTAAFQQGMKAIRKIRHGS